MTDPSVFEEFVRRYQDLVYGIAVRMLGDRSEAEDVSQTVFLRAFERFDAVGRSPLAKAWLRKVTTNLCLNHISRYRSRWRLFSQSRMDRGRPGRRIEDTILAPGSHADDVERDERNARLERGIRGLPDHQRIPLVLFHFEGRSYRDIASLLRVSLSKVKTDIHRGRRALRALLVTEDEAFRP